MGERQYGGSVERLRAPERVRLLEVGHVVDLCLAGEGIATVLDVGTGSGLFAEEFDRRDLMVSGIDVSPAMVAAAPVRAARSLHGGARGCLALRRRRLQPGFPGSRPA